MGNPVGIGMRWNPSRHFIDRCNGIGSSLWLSYFYSYPYFLPVLGVTIFCPTGALLDILRKADTKAGSERRKKVIREFIALAIFLVILYFILR